MDSMITSVMKEASKSLSMPSIDNYMKNVVDDSIYGINDNNKFDTSASSSSSTYMKQVYNTDPVVLGDGFTFSTNPDDWNLYNGIGYDGLSDAPTTLSSGVCGIGGTVSSTGLGISGSCFNDLYCPPSNISRGNSTRYDFNDGARKAPTLCNGGTLTTTSAIGGMNAAKLFNVNGSNGNPAAIGGNVATGLPANPLCSTIGVGGMNTTLAGINNYGHLYGTNSYGNAYSTNSYGTFGNSNYPNYNNSSYGNGMIMGMSNVQFQQTMNHIQPSPQQMTSNFISNYPPTSSTAEPPMLCRSNTLPPNSPLTRSNSNIISTSPLTRSNTLPPSSPLTMNSSNLSASPMVTRSGIMTRNSSLPSSSPLTRGGSLESPKVTTQDLVLFNSLVMESSISTPIRSVVMNKGMIPLGRLKRGADGGRIVCDYNNYMCDGTGSYKFMNSFSTDSSLINPQYGYYDELKTNTLPYYVNSTYEDVDQGYSKSIDNLLSCYQLDNVSTTTGTHVSPVAPETTTTNGSPVMNVVNSTDKFNEILCRCMNENEYEVGHEREDDYILNEVLNSNYVLEAGRKYDETQVGLGGTEEYVVYVRTNPSGDSGKLSLKKQIRSTNPVATSKELNECLLKLKNDESGLSYLPHVTWNWEGVHETSWWMANRDGDIKNYKVQFTPQICGSKAATFDENNKFAKYVESFVSPGSLIQWHPGFNIPIGTNGRANLRKVLHMDRMKNAELCDPVLEANGLKVAAKSTFGDMTIVELYKAAFVLGLWDVAAFNCLKTCKRRGYTFEWIQYIQKSGKRVTLDALKYLRSVKEVIDQHKISKNANYKKKRKFADKTR